MSITWKILQIKSWSFHSISPTPPPTCGGLEALNHQNPFMLGSETSSYALISSVSIYFGNIINSLQIRTHLIDEVMQESSFFFFFYHFRASCAEVKLVRVVGSSFKMLCMQSFASSFLHKPQERMVIKSNAKWCFNTTSLQTSAEPSAGLTSLSTLEMQIHAKSLKNQIREVI